MNPTLEDQIIEKWLSSSHILILPSRPSDGDCLGSALSLYKALTKLGKKVTVISAEPVPKDLKFLPMIEKVDGEFQSDGDFLITVKAHIKNVQHEITPGKVNIILSPDSGEKIKPENISFEKGLEDYDLIVTVDTGGTEQLGEFYEKHSDLFGKIPVINIDHHASNTGFGTLNYVNVKAAATTEMLFPLIQNLEKTSKKKLMDDDIATLLLAGIITDTGSFQHSNTTPQAFAVAAQLLDFGARQQEIIKNVYKTKSLSTLKLWGQVLSKIQFEKEYRFVWSTISQQDLKETGAEMEESGAIIDELLNNAPGAEVVALIKEKQPGLVSVSLRSTVDEVDASEIAGLFGGGGHKRAAGFRLKGVEFQQGVEQIVQTVRGLQAGLHAAKEPSGPNQAPASDKKPEISPDEIPAHPSEAHPPQAKNPQIKIQDTFQGTRSDDQGETASFYHFEQ